MKVRRRLSTLSLSLMLALLSLSAASAPVAAATAVIVSNPPCQPTGAEYSVSKGSSPGEDAHLQKCVYGGFTYVWPSCRAEGGTSDWIDFPYPRPSVTFNECYVFVWTTGGSYVTRFGYTNFTVNTSPDYTYTAFYHPSGQAIKLSGYNVSSEVCATSRYWFGGGGYGEINISCAQSTYGAP